jgi:hypothetical protein
VSQVERRRAERRVPAAGEPLARVRLRTGRELTVINIACRGALLEGAALLPGSYVDLHVTTAHGRALVRGRVVRSYVSGLTADAIWYRNGLSFEQAVDTASAGYPLPGSPTDDVEVRGSRYPRSEKGAARAPLNTLTA